MKVRDFCLYGEATVEIDEYGLPVRLNWASDYRGKATVVYGHIPQLEVQAMNGTYCIDTGCVFGGKLTAYRYPERELVDVDALAQYYAPAKPLSPTQSTIDDMLTVGDVQGRLYLNTALMPSITVQENNAAAALEIMSRFAADPHWLIYLPPTMSPCETSPLDNFLEHPLEAFAYYRSRGIQNVVCEKKHMGSRAVIVLCHTEETARKRFGVIDGTRGIIYTRTGRHFFDDPSVENEILERLDKVLTANNFWSDFATDWVCLDTELMPWSEKAQTLLSRQYAPVGRAGRDSIAAAIAALEETCKRPNRPFEVDATVSGQNVDPNGLLERFREKQHSIDGYIDAYREYCWKVESVDDLRIAPFHLLACEGNVFSKEKHEWHMEKIRQYCTGVDPIFMATEYICVNTADENSVNAGVDWWLKLTSSGGEGMVVKPETFVARRQTEVLQPAVKCRGPEYLRIIYGPEYLMPEHLSRLKKRSLNRKRSLALREFALGMESLTRFVSKEPLYRVHECVFGVLAFESEPVDPRL
jgi:protein phosphatase